jgi:hypothetical protein
VWTQCLASAPRMQCWPTRATLGEISARPDAPAPDQHLRFGSPVVAVHRPGLRTLPLDSPCRGIIARSSSLAESAARSGSVETHGGANARRTAPHCSGVNSTNSCRSPTRIPNFRSLLTDRLIPGLYPKGAARLSLWRRFLGPGLGARLRALGVPQASLDPASTPLWRHSGTLRGGNPGVDRDDRGRAGQCVGGVHDWAAQDRVFSPGGRGRNWSGLREIERDIAEWVR